MKDSLKKLLEELVFTSVDNFKKDKKLVPKRIVVCDTFYKLRDEEFLNYTHNLLLNNSFVRDNKIKVEVIRYYKHSKDKVIGDYSLDVGSWMNPNHSEFS